MPAATLFTVDDGTLFVAVPSCAMYTGGAARSDTETGHGQIEYADGHAARWVRFQALELSVVGMGPAPHDLWQLDLTVPTWTVKVSSFDNNATLDTWVVVPARPVDNRDFNSGRTSWTLTLRSAQAEIPA